MQDHKQNNEIKPKRQTSKSQGKESVKSKAKPDSIRQVYESLLQALRRNDSNKPGELARFYLNIFLQPNREFKADDVYAAGLTREGQNFNQWREEQRKLGWLNVHCLTVGGHPHWKQEPGKKLCKYINRAKMLSGEIASRQEVDELQDQIDVLRGQVELMPIIEERVKNLEAILNLLIAKYDPPVSAEKIAFYSRDPNRLMSAIGH